MALGKGLNSLIPQTRSTVSKSDSGFDKFSIKNDGTQIIQIPISEIVPNAEQPRKNFSHQELEDLVLSIKEHGVMQPITVVERREGGYELIAGERRMRASQIAGKNTVPAIVRVATPQQMLELALIENIQRQDLNPIEEAVAFKRLIEVFGLKQDEVAKKVGKSRSAIANTVRLLDLPNDIQTALMDGKISMGKARALLSLSSEREQLKVFQTMIGESASVRDIEERVRNNNSKSRKGSVRKDPNIMAQQQLLEDTLGTKVTITKKGESGNITIYYDNLLDLKRIISDLI